MVWANYFDYNAETGDLVWKKRQRELFATERDWKIWNTQNAGVVAGARDTGKTGQPRAIVVMLRPRLYLAHRIIWEMLHGEIPNGFVIDHINGNPWDNRLANLRLATRAENNRNRRMSTNNASGLKGVLQRPNGRWKATITINSRNAHLGYYDTAELAHAAYCAAAQIHHGGFARTT